jgi:splicing factor 3B subunit 4
VGQIGRDPDTGVHKGYGFVSFETFEAADAAIEAMHGQFLLNKPITVQYAYKKDGKGERHGSQAGTPAQTARAHKREGRKVGHIAKCI